VIEEVSPEAAGERPAGSARPLVLAVFGPTGVGKTRVASLVAHELGTRVISCDSMQLYRGFPVLTNQPSPEELALAPHALVAVAGPSEEWTAALYAQQARPLIEADIARHGRALLAGGTGLYLRAALAPLDIPEVHDPALRAELDRRAADEGSEALHAQLAVLDPEAAARIHPRNARRVVRALEVVLASGAGAWSGRFDLWEPSYRHPTLVVGLVRERDELYRRIDERAREIFSGGAVDEVRADLETRGLLPGRTDPGPLPGVPAADAGAGTATEPASLGEALRPADAGDAKGLRKAIGYREIAAYLLGSLSREDAVERLAASTRRYARAQLTWLRKLKDAVIIDASPGSEEVAQRVLRLAGRTGER
jgi:tRNA dimethylallyltransferase